MSGHYLKQLKPFLSVLFIIFTLFIMAFFHIEERRLGYSILRVRKEYKRMSEEVKRKEVEIAKQTRPQILEQMAQDRFSLKKTENNQVIYLPEEDEEWVEGGFID